MGDCSRLHIIRTYALEVVETLLMDTMSVAQFIDDEYIEEAVKINNLGLDEEEANYLCECIDMLLTESGFKVISTDEHDEIFKIVQDWAKEKGYQ